MTKRRYIVFLPLAILLMALTFSVTLSQDDPTGLIVVWDVATGEQTLTITLDGPVDFAEFAADGAKIVAQTLGGARGFWDARTGELLFVIPGETGVVEAPSALGESFFLFSVFNTLHVWDLFSGEARYTLEHDGQILGTAWNTDETQLLSWADDNTARIWDTRTGDQLLRLYHTYKNYIISVYGARWNADETRILTWASDGKIRLWDAVTGEQIMVYAPVDQSTHWNVNYARWNDDETRILSAENNNALRVWDAITSQELFSIRYQRIPLTLRWNADETHIMARSHGDVLWLWDAETGKQLFQVHPDGTIDDGRWIAPYLHARWNPGGDRFMTWGLDPNLVYVWDVDDQEQIAGLWHSFPAMALHTVDRARWSKDGSQILSWAGADPGVGGVWVWDVASPDTPLFEGHICCAELFGASWSADETQVLAWGNLWHMCGCE